MNKTEEKIKAIASENPTSKWKEKVAFRKANKATLRQAAKVALRLLDALEEKGWSQAQLARELEVTPQQVSKWVKGEGDFKFSTIDKLEKVLGITMHAVLAEDEFVSTEEAFEARLNEEVMAYHQRWTKTQEYLKLKKQVTNPQMVMAVSHADKDVIAMAG
ncbi:helix-turn-helix transcriptional regulator [Belliella kenyensis]|uniref:Helix-turn-helix transcriptional regulator n=1 Tax=Belliella kenyensis TaxID=1472724 RepID=A0ABV8EM76_9BACT|nr:helix-turn-helix transcriptional regulator [Belliella kenyensis]MCH7400339.1 helix-turn-helix domain-containing protein [Belliella kenyensis]MDN3604643.1 helix-turn-helix transcriptional regulator [Belliella kenyensis]